MPRAKRDKEVTLTKTTKKTRESKVHLVNQIKQALGTYAGLFVFNFENLRSSQFTKIRQLFKNDSQFFLGKKTVMTLALGRTKEDESGDGLHKVSQSMEGQCGLLFTNKKKSEIIKFFQDYEVNDFSRAGAIASYAVSVPAGPLPQFPHSMEPHLKKLGLPTKLEKGVVEMISEYTVCKAGDTLTPEQCKILKLFGEKMSQFRVNIIAYWTEKKGFETI